MRKTIIFLTFLMTMNCVDAQIPVGVKYDINGMPLNGYLDQIIYSPKKKISNVHYSGYYESGYYYDSLGTKIKGLIEFKGNFIFFKKKEEDKGIMIKSGEIRSFVIGIDSFFVVDKFRYKNRIKEKPDFVQYITEFNGYTFAKHYHFGSFNNKTFLVKHRDSMIWDNFPDNWKFKERALKYFSYIPYIKNKISSGEYDSEDMLSIIKMAEYLDKYNKSEPIFYDKYWQETRASDKAVYSAKISNKVDSIWTFEYYKDKTKIYQANYSSFYPNIKNGDFIAFYPNGETRQIVTFADNKPIEVKTFSENGMLKTQYEIVEKNYKSSSRTDIDIKYIVVNDSLGKNILESNNLSVLPMKDELNGYIYKSTYKNKRLVSVHRIYKKHSIFQIPDPNYYFNIRPLQKRFDRFMSDKKYENALNENAQGIILVSLLIAPNGHVLESTVLNHIHPELDSLVDNFIKSKLLKGAKYRYIFKPYKKDKEKRFCEFVIPFEFSIYRFYRKPEHYNNFYFQNWMMQQQMMNNFGPSVHP